MSTEFSELLCRACLQEDELMVDIYEQVEELQMNLSALLERCGDIKVNRTDAYPKYLCQECTNELLIAAKFRKKCAETEQTLRQRQLECEKSSIREESLDEELVEDYNETIEFHADEHVEYELVSSTEECQTALGTNEYSKAVTEITCGYNCDVCGAAFQQAATLQRHIEKTHAAIATLSCEQCGHSFTQQANLMTHSCSREGQPAVGQRRHRCLHCGKFYQSASSLAMHMRSHNGERPYSCDVCAKAFKTNSALVGHQKGHMQLAQHKCPHCEKGFVESSNLRRHIVALHTAERPHSCTVCQRSFSRVYLLELHMRTHTGERPYECAQCGRRFAQLGVLRSHERTHTGERRHRCGLCEKSFGRALQLKQHERRHWMQQAEQHQEEKQKEQDEGAHELEKEEDAVFETVVISEEVVNTADDDASAWYETLTSAE